MKMGTRLKSLYTTDIVYEKHLCGWTMVISMIYGFIGLFWLMKDYLVDQTPTSLLPVEALIPFVMIFVGGAGWILFWWISANLIDTYMAKRYKGLKYNITDYAWFMGVIIVTIISVICSLIPELYIQSFGFGLAFGAIWWGALWGLFQILPE